MVTIVDLIPDIEQTHYPLLDAVLCVHGTLVDASCRACIRSCPRHAWRLTDEALEIDTGACDGCGLCLPACPQQALSLPIQPAYRYRGQEKIALAACDRVVQIGQEGAVPCLHRFGIRELMDAHARDVREWIIATGDCGSCERATNKTIQFAVRLLNLALLQRHLPEISLHEKSSSDWTTVLESPDTTDQRPVSRRDFFRGISRTRTEAGKQDNGKPVRGQLLNSEGLMPCRCSIDTETCDLCDACCKVCPTNVIRFEKGENRNRLIVDSSACNGCMHCVDVCEATAVSVSPWKQASIQAIACDERRCSTCGVDYQSFPEDSGSLCRICRKTDHRRSLFQTFT